ncbi:restin homolog isoform X1 [Nematostella vectensis]|uniref:restin homolog isoform X1 n=1 Tax=Nematostella vectensis TaxID=45351 RepID=UPI0020778984|nr:restin homolog isoform X1 [Nematostella vectensis]
MPISSFYRQKENTARKPWNSTRIHRKRSAGRMAWMRENSEEKKDNKEGQEDSGDGFNDWKYRDGIVKCYAKPASVRHRPTDRRQRAKTSPSPRKLSTHFTEIRCNASTRFERCKSDSHIIAIKTSRPRKEREFCRERSEAYARQIKEKRSGKRKLSKVDAGSIPSQPQASPRLFYTDQKRLPSLGDRVVCVLNKRLRTGVLQFTGTTHFSPGEWCGIVLDDACGKNDGSVKGVRYFDCKQDHGIFVHAHKVRALEEVAVKLTISEAGLLNLQQKGNKRIANHHNNNNMESVGIQSIGVEPVTLRKWPPHYNGTARPRSFSSGMKYGLNLEPSSYGIECLPLDLVDLSRSVSLPKISSNKSSLVSDGLNLIALKCEEQVISNESKRGSCPDISLPRIEQNSPKTSSTEECEQDMCCSSNANGADDLMNIDPLSPGYESQERSHECPVSLQHINTKGNTMLIRSHSVEDLRAKNPVQQPSVAHASLEKQTTIDAFSQGKYCSCPALVPTQHVSGAIEACIDLGRQGLHDEKKTHGKSASTSDTPNQERSSPMAVNLTKHGHSSSMPKLNDCSLMLNEMDSVSSSNLERSSSWPCLTPTPEANKEMSPVFIELFVISDNIPEETQDGESIVEMSEELTCTDAEREESVSEGSKKPSCEMAKRNNTGRQESHSLSSSLASVASSTSTVDSRSSRTKTKNNTLTKRSINSKKSVSQKSTKDNGNSKGSSSRASERGVGSKQVSVSSLKEAPPRVVKRHTVSSLQQFKLDFSNRPSMSHRPSSTLSEPDPAKQRKSSDVSHRLSASPNSRLPMIRRVSQPATKPTTGTSSRTDRSRPAPSPDRVNQATATQSAKKVGSTASTEKQKKELSSSSTSSLRGASARRKVSAPVVSNQTLTSVQAKRLISTATTQGKPARTPFKAEKKTPSETKSALTSSKKPSPLATKPPSSAGHVNPPPSRPQPHHPSRLPRKISRDPSTDSTLSGDQDLDQDAHRLLQEVYPTVSDNGMRFPRQDSYPTGYDADLESSTRSWHSPLAPDILTGVKESRRRSVEVQVEIDDDQALQDMHDKLEKLDHMLQARGQQCQELKTRLGDADHAHLSSAILLIGLERKLRASARHVSQLVLDLQSAEDEIRQTRERLDEEEANSVKLEEEMMYLRSEHKVAIETLKADHERTIDGLRYTLKKQQMEELALAAQEHVDEIQQIQKQHEAQLNELQAAHGKAVEAVHEQYRDEIVELESKHSAHVEEILEEHQLEIETIKADYEEQRSALETKLFSVTSECTSLNIKLQRLQEETEQDIENRIQDAIEKYKSLPDELASMKAVLDMKNDEIKQLRKDRMEAKMELDHLRTKADRIRKLEQENESLSFVVETKSKFERQLSVERETLKTTLERESAKLKRLSLENEELQWRLYNCPSSPGCDGPESPLPASRNSHRLSSSFSDADPIHE